MKLKITMLALVLMCVSELVHAQMAASPLNMAGSTDPKLHIGPSSTTLLMGQAGLVVDPLTHKGKFYVGCYQLKVLPYFFKSEKGRLELEATDDAVRKLLAGVAVNFTGKATNNKNDKPKVVVGRATPSTKDRGRVTFSIATDNGPLVFDTSYHFGA